MCTMAGMSIWSYHFVGGFNGYFFSFLGRRSVVSKDLSLSDRYSLTYVNQYL